MLAASVVLAVVLGSMPAQGAARSYLAIFEMNEGPGATVMTNAVAGGPVGEVRASVQTGVSLVGGGTGYLWGTVRPNVDYDPNRVIRVDDVRMNPGTSEYAVTFRYRTPRPFGNIMQKGQATNREGQFKIQLPQGNISCMYTGVVNGSLVRRSIRSSGAYNDNTWHVVRCERTTTQVLLRIWDGTVTSEQIDAGSAPVPLETKSIRGATGSINNSNYPFVVGGKINCDQVETTCDYYQGEIDWVRVQKGS